MSFFQVFIGDMGIDLCGGDGGVPEHSLDGSYVRTVLEEVSSEAMS